MSAELWDLFHERLDALGGRAMSLDEALAQVLHPVWVDPDCVDWVPVRSDAPSPWEAVCGFTQADLAIAETGSLMLASSARRHRLASLACEIHIAIVSRDAIVATLEEAFERVSGRTTVLVTGPSRTADIEGVLVRGIHGPRELWVATHSP